MKPNQLVEFIGDIRTIRAEAFEDAARLIEKYVEILSLPESPQYEGDDRPIVRRTVSALAKAIRAMKEGKR